MSGQVGIGFYEPGQPTTREGVYDISWGKDIADFERYKAEGSAVIINHARTQMVCVVKKILHLNNNEDNFLVCQILSHKENKKLEFLSLEDVY